MKIGLIPNSLKIPRYKLIKKDLSKKILLITYLEARVYHLYDIKKLAIERYMFVKKNCKNKNMNFCRASSIFLKKIT